MELLAQKLRVDTMNILQQVILELPSNKDFILEKSNSINTPSFKEATF
jgi:hypothetical protein